MTGWRGGCALADCEKKREDRRSQTCGLWEEGGDDAQGLAALAGEVTHMGRRWEEVMSLTHQAQFVACRSVFYMT